MIRTLLAISLLSLALSASVAARDPAKDGLTLIDTGSSAYYDASWDGAGWDRIRRTQAANNGLSADAVYDPDGFYCVKIGYPIGAILTVRNAQTGATATCMVADTNAPQDNAVWLSRWVVEMSWRCFTYLGLDNGNSVEVWG